MRIVSKNIHDEHLDDCNNYYINICHNTSLLKNATGFLSSSINVTRIHSLLTENYKKITFS